ncbi:MAG: CRISPR-associated primase-polymerase type A1 [Gemmatimonadota bacterium]|jgi:group II intron reverse transcriptase/maturase
MSFLEDLASFDTLHRAWEDVAAKKGAAGIDRVSVEDLAPEADRHLRRLAEEIRDGRYRPLPVLRIRPRFLQASDRALVVPTVRDRIVQRAVSNLLTPRIDPLLSPACRAFRKGCSAREAAEDVGRWIEEGHPWVLRADVRSFFDSIRPEILREKLEPFVDEEGLRFLDRILRRRVFDHHQVTELVVGIAQGSPLSPLLGNLYLHEVDGALYEEFPQIVRYCDDLIVLADDEATVRRAHERLLEFLRPLELELNEDKTRICRAEDGFTFLGYHFGAAGRGPSAKAVEALHARLEELATEAPLDPGDVDAVHRGWTAYFGDHPECWLERPAGILALLRAADRSAVDALSPKLIEARWRHRGTVSAPLGLELARAWIDGGRAEQAWLEMADACSGSRTAGAVLEDWAEVLAVTPDALAPLARNLVGDWEARLAHLAEAAGELGRYEVGSRLAQLRSSGLLVPETAPPPSEFDEVAGPELRLLEDWFQGREGVHAVESVNRGGHRSFVPVRRPITADDWQAHLRGERTLGLPLVRAGDTVVLGVLDVDVTRKARDQHPEHRDDHLQRALGTALRLRHALERRGCGSLLELSGAKGHHVWVRLEAPVASFQLRRWLLALVEEVGELPDGIRVEVFPNRDRVRGDDLGPVVKLPLGVHSKTGHRCHLLDERGEPLEDPFQLLREVGRVSRSVILEDVAPQTLATEEDGSAEGAAEPEDATPERGIGPRARKILDGCNVLGYLAKKARDTAYLDHRERNTLLCTLGHLGDEGRAALHAIIGHSYNYRPEVTDRHVDRLPEFPMSCPKVKELHPEAAAVAPCTCRFRLGRGAYPTPLLFGVKASEVQAFRKRREQQKDERTADAAPERGPVGSGRKALREEVEAILRKLAELRRHHRGITRTISRLEGDLAEALAREEADTLETSMGLLRRVERDDGSGHDFVIEV